ncbi:PSD1 and planctomycete cytochrome C domain-containing protein [Urbifossiella limnaea]|uniref:Planctomycete cytochrome C n=1 Tax=Urbifossiella limnaea TaxID=2528023 RepID=A0A517XY07_9BACT|nr:PSD1 and planctomycete cytochrome C domain-containing protein [Urbifossiella limnaea]QDU22391.1 Planctomycete cytochrome C [Urbifossiella limnaea]
MPPLSRLAPALLLLAPAPARADEPVDFARDVRPLLSNSCFKCHGPASQMGKVRLDTREAAVKSGAIVPGSPDKSTLVERVCEPSDDDRMPPPEAGPRLTAQQVKTLKQWIAEGAEYTPHWAFQRVVRPQPPTTKTATRYAIDRFVLARLEKAGLTMSAEADRSTLLRRVTLDLTGLLPTPVEVLAFLDDRSPDAYEKAVDRLLASPHYGERHARHWLDLARYADSNGYTIDGARSIWPYRDWVVRALNADLPFDQFTTHQLAGDLLPGATADQKIATGFHRNTSFNEEGGTDPEQFRVERTVDRANTTGAVWLGLTVGCAQCHTHKYDPVTQHDYYRLYAFFDSCDEPTMPIGGTAKMEEAISRLNQMEAWIQKNGGSREDIDLVKAEIKRVQGKVTTTLVMRERPAARTTHVQIRGDFLRKGDVVQPGFPAALGATPAGKRQTRLDLAKWLVSRDNPLTARVTVNREWQKFFGRGLVETENDFGMQGALPTHPELLDWLAVQFMEPLGWSMKKLHRQIVLSATYRQASVVRPDLTQRDPRNLLLGRQSRLRLEAEVIRDAALSASGKLNTKVGGPGVYPPQPKEVFAFTQSQRTWPESKGPDRYRRGVYTYIWRQSQHPLLTTFDGADAQTACTKRNRSNTPLQALHLANDPVFVELATELGRRVDTDGGADDAAKVRFAYRACFGRDPTTQEAARVLAYLEAQRRTDAVGAWPATARVLMNLDEFITRE